MQNSSLQNPALISESKEKVINLEDSPIVPLGNRMPSSNILRGTLSEDSEDSQEPVDALNNVSQHSLISTKPESPEIIEVEHIPEPRVKGQEKMEDLPIQIPAPIVKVQEKVEDFIIPVETKPLKVDETPKQSEIDIAIGNILKDPSETQFNSVDNEDLKNVHKPLPVSNLEIESAINSILGEEPKELDILPTLEIFQPMLLPAAAPMHPEQEAENLQSFSFDHPQSELFSFSERIPEDIFDEPSLEVPELKVKEN